MDATHTSPEAPVISAATSRIPVFVYAADPISQAGTVAQLRAMDDVEVLADVDAATVAVVVTEQVDDLVLSVISGIQRDTCPKVLMVVTQLDEPGVLRAVEAGVSGLVRRADADPVHLLETIKGAAQGDGTVPPDLLGQLLRQVGRLQRQVLTPRGLTLSGLTERELEVLRLVADGWDTAEIADQLCYSERTVKNVIHDVTSRLQLRNRSHAVAYAVREGLI